LVFFLTVSSWMMSAPVPDWIAEVMRACRSLPLMVSNAI
jgi:hypothetical protein